MRATRGPRAAAQTLLAIVIALAAGAPLVSASDSALRLVDGDGVLHLTNVPADPRYRSLAGASGTAAGWLRLPPKTWAQYASDIQEISRQHGVSAGLIESVILTESGFDPTAVSPKGAGGLMQLMPQTAAALGVLNRFNARENISGGVRHLRYLLDRYQANVGMALAAYNAGEAAVDAHRGVPPFPETQQYVQRVLRLAGLTGAAGGAQALYRYTDPDNTLTYSNFPPPARPTDSRRQPLAAKASQRPVLEPSDSSD
jgi:soluble lytic murein transglycosylase-like protein